MFYVKVIAWEKLEKNGKPLLDKKEKRYYLVRSIKYQEGVIIIEYLNGDGIIDTQRYFTDEIIEMNVSVN